MADDQPISDGYFLTARQLFKSAIWRENLHVTKLFIYLFGKARHNPRPKKFSHFEIKRGELVTSLQQIVDDNEYLERKRPRKWSRAKVSRLLHYLADEKYIEILADTYGTHIKVLNYRKYQDPKSYKADRSETQVKRNRTVVKTYNKENNVNNDNNDNKQRENFLPPDGLKLNSNGHDWIEADWWDKFVDHRSEINKPLTKSSVDLLLEILKENKRDQVQIIKNSITGGYPGLYPLRKQKDSSGWDELKKEFCE